MYILLVAIEESLEMAGVILFIRGLLAYIADYHRHMLFSFDPDRGKES